MKCRYIEEICKEIEDVKRERLDLINAAGYMDRGGWRWRDSSLIKEINAKSKRIHNLYAELNRAKQRMWGSKMK